MASAPGRAGAVTLAALLVLLVAAGGLLAVSGPPVDDAPGSATPAASPSSSSTPPADGGTAGTPSPTPSPPADGDDPTGTVTPTSAPTATSTPTSTPRSDRSGRSGGSDPDEASDGDAGTVEFALVVESVTECGTRCRDVTATLSNVGDADAEDVEVRTRLLTGGVEIWEDEVSLGDVPAGESATRTQRVTVGFLEAARIQANDGVVTIETRVTWDGGSQTVREQEDVL
jgi:hypothetical protein